MKILLEKIGILNLKNEKLRSQNDFNIFTLLRNKSDEVNLHSRFIYELLNPTGSHRKDSDFLESFLKIASINGFNIKNIQVFKEFNNIDVLITNQRQAIIMENKIWAVDQNRQLERYYNYIKNKGYTEIWIVYLTLNGDLPHGTSIGNLSKNVIFNFLKPISYSHHIYSWLEKCISKSSKNPFLRETLIQYSNLIQEMTGKSMNQDQREEVYELLSQQDNIHKAFTIASNWIHIKWHVEWNFWVDFENIIAQEFVILPNQKYSKSLLNSVIHDKKNRNPWFGIMFEIFSIGEDRFCILIERGWGDLYYGITILNNDKREHDNYELYSEFYTKLNEFTDWKKGHVWLGGNMLKPNVNFDLFSQKETLDLINEHNRREYLKGNWIEIKEFIKKARQIR